MLRRRRRHLTPIDTPSTVMESESTTTSTFYIDKEKNPTITKCDPTDDVQRFLRFLNNLKIYTDSERKSLSSTTAELEKSNIIQNRIETGTSTTPPTATEYEITSIPTTLSEYEKTTGPTFVSDNKNTTEIPTITQYYPHDYGLRFLRLLNSWKTSTESLLRNTIRTESTTIPTFVTDKKKYIAIPTMTKYYPLNDGLRFLGFISLWRTNTKSKTTSTLNRAELDTSTMVPAIIETEATLPIAIEYEIISTPTILNEKNTHTEMPTKYDNSDDVRRFLEFLSSRKTTTKSDTTTTPPDSVESETSTIIPTTIEAAGNIQNCTSYLTNNTNLGYHPLWRLLWSLTGHVEMHNRTRHENC